MEYHITVKNTIDGDFKRIASFENESDRDIALDALADYFDDCPFQTEDG